jgi:hypothetical protein
VYVVAGITAENAAGQWVKCSVSLDDEDFLHLVYEKRVPGYVVEESEDRVFIADENGDEMTVVYRHRAMMLWADILLTTQLEDAGILTKEQGRAQKASNMKMLGHA